MTIGEKEKEQYRTRWELAEKLKAEGLTGREIAKQIGVTPGRVSQVLGQRRAKSEPQT